MRQMTIVCPYDSRYRVELDKDEIIPDNPGEGTPAMVYGPNESSGTFYAAQNEGELCCGPREHTLPDIVTRWLNDIDEEVDDFLW